MLQRLWIHIVIELSRRVLRRLFKIAGHVALLHLLSAGNGIVAGDGIRCLGAELVRVSLLHIEAPENEEADIQRAEIHIGILRDGGWQYNGQSRELFFQTLIAINQIDGWRV